MGEQVAVKEGAAPVRDKATTGVAAVAQGVWHLVERHTTNWLDWQVLNTALYSHLPYEGPCPDIQHVLGLEEFGYDDFHCDPIDGLCRSEFLCHATKYHSTKVLTHLIHSVQSPITHLIHVLAPYSH